MYRSIWPTTPKTPEGANSGLILRWSPVMRRAGWRGKLHRGWNMSAWKWVVRLVVLAVVSAAVLGGVTGCESTGGSGGSVGSDGHIGHNH